MILFTFLYLPQITTLNTQKDFDFDIVNFPVWTGAFPVLPLTVFTRFARVSSHVTDFNARNKILTGKLLHQGYRYHKLRKAFSKFYRRHYELVSKFKVGLKSLLQQGLSEPEFYGDLVYKLRKFVSRVIMPYNRIGYNNVMRQSACLVINPILCFPL